MNKKVFKLSEVLVIMVVTAFLSFLMAGFVAYHTVNKINTDGVTNKHIKEFINIYNELLGNFYVDVNEGELIDSAINGMTSYLDESYTSYLTEEQKASLMESLDGSYEGIGVQITGDLVVDSVFDDSPAFKAGILSGDIITRINGVEVTGKSSSDVVSMIKSSKDERVEIAVRRGEQEIAFNIARKKLDVPSVYSKVIENTNHGYIYISNFSNTTKNQFAKQLKELENANIDGLIIDVRGNSGGYLSSAKDIASIFIEQGKVIYSLENKKETTEYKDETKEQKEIPVVILINHGSASASEILAAALKDSYGAVLVGKTSYGKGKVQQTQDLSTGSMIKYTTAKWLRPNGECIDGVGLIPDYEVELVVTDGEVVDDQLNKAIELLDN